MDQFEQLDYYELLGVSRAATADELKRAYRQQMARYHPDRIAGAGAAEQAEAGRRAQRINEAYQVLGDFAARTAYNRSLAPGALPGRAAAASAPAPPPRDHLAELYEQARSHLQAGRNLQAVATLRELQRLNPFYRDSAALLEQAETAARPAPARAAAPPPLPAADAAPGGRPNRSRRALIVGGLGGLLLVGGGVVAWALRRPGASAAGGAAGLPAGGSAVEMPSAPSAATAVSSVPAAPTAAPATAVPEPSATPLPTAAPTAAPLPTAAPSATPPATATPAPLAEEGALLYADDFAGGGWPSISDGSWSVGFAPGGYRISAQQGTGNIWAFSTSPAGADGQIAVDVAVVGGLAGLLLRYTQGSYLAYFVDPAAGSLRLEQWVGGSRSVLLETPSPAVRAGADARNRLLVRLDGEQVGLRINGVLVADLRVASPALSPRYGMLAVATAAEVEALFSDLAIREL